MTCVLKIAWMFTLCLEIVFQVALDKLFRFATTKVFESETAGQMCCDMCAAAAKVQC